VEDFEKLHTDIGREVFTCVFRGDDSLDSSFSSRGEGWWMYALSIYVFDRKVYIYDIFVCIN